MCHYVIFVLLGFWMSTFSHDASGKYCICEATVGGVQFCEKRKWFGSFTELLCGNCEVALEVLLRNSKGSIRA